MKPTIQKVVSILDGFPGYMQRKHKGRNMTTNADIRQRQIEWLLKHLNAAYQQGYNDCNNHYQGRK